MTNPLNPNDAGATLTFDDEFNSLSLWNGTSGTWDTTYIFASPTGNGSTLASNGEQEWYINSNYAPTDSVKPWTVNNGILTITAAPASAAIQPLINGYQYTSGQLNTSQSFSQTYGYFEMTAKLPAGQGMWPAFWLLPESGAWPPEIDAMEVLGNNPSTLYTSVHSGTASDEISSDQANTVANTSTSFNTYGVDWEPNFITWYFDGQPVYQVATPAALQNIPMYMIVNLAVGGGWPGDVNSTTPMPAQMQIEDVRAFASLPDAAYLAAEGGGTPPVSTSTPPATSTSVATSAATYIAPSGVVDITLTGTAPQTVTANSLNDVITSNDYGSTLIGGSGNDTFIAGHGADVMTGGGGSNVFEFNYLPWNAGQITNFHIGTDTLDLSALLKAAGYTGSNAIADGYVSLVSDGKGDTEVIFHTNGPATTIPIEITTLDGIAPSQLTAANLLGETGSSGSSSSSSSSSSSTPPTVVDISAATYTLASNVTDVVLTGTASQTVTANSLNDVITSNDYGSTLIGGSGNDTFIAGHGADVMTGGGGSDVFEFNYLPWNAGQITNFHIGTDTLDLNALLSAAGYTGSNAVADGYVSLVSDGKGDTEVIFHTNGPATTIPIEITTLDGIAPSQLTAANLLGETGASGSSSSSPSSSPVDTTAATYIMPSNVEDVVLTGTASQTVTGNSLSDVITSNDYGSTLIGGTGNDTFIAGHGADVMTGGGGHNTFEFNYLPWNAGQITNFHVGTDTLDLNALLSAADYTGSNAVADGYVSLVSDGKGDTEVIFHTTGPATTIPIEITTLDGIAPSQLTAANLLGETGSSGSSSSSTPPTVVDISAATYTMPSNVTDVVLTGTAAQTVTGNSLNDIITSNDYGSTLIAGSGNDTLIAGHGADVLTGGAGSDTFEFNYQPWNAGQITNFNPATDVLDLHGLFAAVGYHGTNPVADGYLSFVSDGAGDTKVIFDPQGPSTTIPIQITTLEHVSPASLQAHTDWIF